MVMIHENQILMMQEAFQIFRLPFAVYNLLFFSFFFGGYMSDGYVSPDFIKFGDQFSFSIAIQSRLTIFDHHIDDGVCM